MPAPDPPYDVLEPAFSLTVSCVVSGQSDTASFPLVSVLLRKTAFPDDEAVWLLPETRTDPDMHTDVPVKNWHTDFLVLPMLSDIPLPFPDHGKHLCHRDITFPIHTGHTGFLFPHIVLGNVLLFPHFSLHVLLKDITSLTDKRPIHFSAPLPVEAISLPLPLEENTLPP